MDLLTLLLLIAPDGGPTTAGAAAGAAGVAGYSIFITSASLIVAYLIRRRKLKG
jgi:hypothetical protein